MMLYLSPLQGHVSTPANHSGECPWEVNVRRSISVCGLLMPHSLPWQGYYSWSLHELKACITLQWTILRSCLCSTQKTDPIHTMGPLRVIPICKAYGTGHVTAVCAVCGQA